MALRNQALPWRLPIAVLSLSLLIAGTGHLSGRDASVDVAQPDGEPGRSAPGGLQREVGATDPEDVDRIRRNVAFWSGRADAHPADFVSATRWAEAEIDLARATGDVTRFLMAEQAIERALATHPRHRPALGLRGVVLVALHRFEEARDHARHVLDEAPGDPVALATLGDAALALGEMANARGAYEQLTLLADGAAVRVRRAHLAFIEGDPAGAVARSREALELAIAEGQEGTARAWYGCQLGATLASTGDLEEAAAAWHGALHDDPRSPLARSGLARVAAAHGRWDEAIEHLDGAIAVIPSPEFVARRADLYRLRGAAGDDRREHQDRQTVLAIAALGGDAAGVHDRTLSLYLATHEDPRRALALAEGELAVRRDVYGYDALAWALHANGRDVEAQAAITEALSLGTRDARFLFHAGMIAAGLGQEGEARAYLEDALALDPSFDPLAVREARDALSATATGARRP